MGFYNPDDPYKLHNFLTGKSITGKYDGTALICPSKRYGGNQVAYPYSRYLGLNIDAQGGFASPSFPSYPETGTYGKSLDVTTGQAPYPYRSPQYDAFYLGAKTHAFKNPASQYLLFETEFPRDDLFAKFPWNYVLGDNPSFPAYSGFGGWFSFRHVGKSSNPIYIDGHIGSVTFQTADAMNKQKWFIDPDDPK